MFRKVMLSLIVLLGSVFSAACKPVQISPTSTPEVLPADNAMPSQPIDVAVNEAYDYCFAYPQGFTQQAYNEQIEVYWPLPGVGSLVTGIVWIDVLDPQGRTAQEIAEKEANEFGLNPPRFTVMLGGEEALVMNGMPGQDAVRKVYIVHNGSLYTLSFAPHLSGDEEANTRMEKLFAAVTASWVWISSGTPCPVSG